MRALPDAASPVRYTDRGPEPVRETGTVTEAAGGSDAFALRPTRLGSLEVSVTSISVASGKAPFLSDSPVSARRSTPSVRSGKVHDDAFTVILADALAF